MPNKNSGLGRGLDSLIPNIELNDEEEISSLTLEDMLEKSTDAEKKEENKSSTENSTNKNSKTVKKDQEESKIKEESRNQNSSNSKTKETQKTEGHEKSSTKDDADSKNDSDNNSNNENISKNEAKDESKAKDGSKAKDESKAEDNDNTIETSNNKDFEPSEADKNNIQEVINAIEKNPRITLWTAQSAAVFRYLRKTKPEFSISKEASSLIDEAVSKKYPEIWELFNDLNQTK